MQHPYKALPSRQYWASAIETADTSFLPNLVTAKRKIGPADLIGSAGSCFAQHISRNLRERGFNFVDVEPAPGILPKALRGTYGYELYSARYGNIYTAAQLKQLVLRAFRRHRFQPQEKSWMKDGRFYDPFRPTIEPDGFASLDELHADVESHLKRVSLMFRRISLFVFTLGLTEAWMNKLDGAVYPVAPGVRGIGSFDPTKYEFKNFSYEDIRADLELTFAFLRRINPDLRILLTVSPVPLAATASEEHVLTATTYSKSVLRAVAGSLTKSLEYVDYFPSYELITAPIFKGEPYKPNWRDVNPSAVSRVMAHFFDTFVEKTPIGTKARRVVDKDQHEVVCDEAVLASYATT